MKHLLNNLSEEEKNSIREQHTGGMQVSNNRFNTLLESTLGNAKPLVEQFDDEDDYEDDFDNIDYGSTKNGLGSDDEELDEDTSWMDEL